MGEGRAMDKEFMRIGEVAERTSLTQRTLRFYEEKGLLDPPTRLEGGFRLYSEEDVQRIEHVLQLKHLLGFSLAEIKQMMDAENELDEIKAVLRQESLVSTKLARAQQAMRVIEQQAAHIDQKIEQLQQMRAKWQRRLERYREHYGELRKDLRPETIATH